MNFLSLLLCVIELLGVTGSDLRARAFFDANNVKVGDPLTLTIDFLGEAEFRDLHPPQLAELLSKRDWRLDDASAKTMTYRDARRLTYRVRPIREGVLWFPALEFEYTNRKGQACRVQSNEIPVHARGGIQMAVQEMEDDTNEMPQPPDLVRTINYEMTKAQQFAWRKACARPKAEAFAEFAFPEARMNEATCAIREGNWSRALKIYRVLEWKIGQTPEIERGIIAAVALSTNNPAAELPVWRQVFRPLLRFGWEGRLLIVTGVLVVFILLVWLIGRGIRALACVAVAFACCASLEAKDMFQIMEEQMSRMQKEAQQAFGRVSGFIGGETLSADQIVASVQTDRPRVTVGEGFSFVLSLEYPRTLSVHQIRLSPSEHFGLRFTGKIQNLTDGVSANPSNVIKRLSVPVRYDVPYRGPIAFLIEGMMSGSSVRNGGRFSFSISNSFRAETAPIQLNVQPLSGQPADFSGIISEGLRAHELCDRLTVGSNDVVTVTYKLHLNGYVPTSFLPPGSAFEWSRQMDDERNVREIEYRRYFVADGAPRTPVIHFSYYDPIKKKYQTVTVGGTPIQYDIISQN